MTWRCAICGCGFEEAQAKRRHRREPLMASVVVQTCSRACEEKRQAGREQARGERRARERRPGRVRRRRRRTTRPRGYWLRRYRRLRVPREQGWRCRECSCCFDEAQAKRRRRGEQEIRSLLARTCSASCRRIYRTRIIRRWERLHPEAVKESWRRGRLKKRRKRHRRWAT